MDKEHSDMNFEKLQLYQVAAERYNIIQQQSQTAINISTVSVMAFGAAIGGIFASLANARDVYRFYADLFIILVSVVAIGTSIVCREILERSSKVTIAYENYLVKLELDNNFIIKPHSVFKCKWTSTFDKYEPYKMTKILLSLSSVLYGIFIIAAVLNGLYLFFVLKVNLGI